MGCMDWLAKAEAMARACASLRPALTLNDFTAMWLSVNVPVLSKMTVSIWSKLSMACKCRIKMPRFTKALALASMAAGVANDRAHGQVTINTAAAVIKAWPWPCSHSKTADSTALSKMKNKKGLATRSASCDSRGFSMAAWLINCTICPYCVDSPKVSKRMVTVAPRL